MANDLKCWRDFLDLLDLIIGVLEPIPERKGSPFLHWPMSELAGLATCAKSLGLPKPPVAVVDGGKWLLLHGPYGSMGFAHFGRAQDGSIRLKGLMTDEKAQIVGVLKQWRHVAQRKAATASPPSDPARARSPTETLSTLSASARSAYQSYEFAVGIDPNLKTDDEVHEYLRHHADPEAPDYKLPKRENWKRYLRSARRKLNTSKHSSESRSGHSVVSKKQV